MVENKTPRSDMVVIGKNQVLKLLKGISRPPAKRIIAAKISTAIDKAER